MNHPFSSWILFCGVQRCLDVDIAAPSSVSGVQLLRFSSIAENVDKHIVCQNWQHFKYAFPYRFLLLGM